jgi:hypothetical protein
MKKIIDIITWPFRKFMEKRRLKKRLAELRNRDPFIYK